jgi:hypothetical protein
MMRRFVVAALAAFIFAACTNPKHVVSGVTRVHTLPPDLSGQTFVIAAHDAQGQSPAFRTYADEVKSRLTHLGLRAAVSREDAAKVWQNPADYPGGELPEPQAPDYVVTLTYGIDGPTRRVEIDLYKGSTYDTANEQRLFEGHALSTEQSGQLESVVPYMLDALLQDFPGRSGETKRVSIAVPSGPPADDHTTPRLSDRSQ